MYQNYTKQIVPVACIMDSAPSVPILALENSGNGSSSMGESGNIRQRWDSRIKFLAASVASAVGLGNVWRFPFLVYKNGGGAFMIPFFLCLIFVGIPLLFLELALGQQTQKGAVHAMATTHGRFWGVGFAAPFASFCMVIYYNVIIAWSWIYFFTSFQGDLPWEGGQKAAEDFFYKDVLQFSGDVHDVGSVQYKICLSLLLTWLVIYFCIWKDVKILGKISAWVMPIPVLVLVILFIRGLTLEGAGQGIQYFWEPDVEKILDPKVWLDAMAQIFFSIAIGLGVMIAYGSYLPRDHDTFTEALSISCIDVLFSIFAGMTVFSYLGHMAHVRDLSVSEVTSGGPSLAFVVFPDALAMMPLPQLFSILFFAMILLLGIPTAFSLVVAFTAIIYDKFPHLRNHTEATSGAICLVGFFSGILMTTEAGLCFIDLVDHYVSNYLLILIGLLESIAVGWFYPAESLSQQFQRDTKRRIPRVWIYLVKFLIPVAISSLFMYNLINEFVESYGGYPPWAIFTGWVMVIIACAVMIYGAFSPIDEGKQRITELEDIE